MKCAAKDCNQDATNFYLGYGRAKPLRCDEHRAQFPSYPIAVYDSDRPNTEIRQQYTPLPPPEIPRHDKVSRGWGDLRPPQARGRVHLTGALSQFYGVQHQAFKYWYVEDMIYPGSTDVVMDGDPFHAWLDKLKMSAELSLCRRSLATLRWNRDPVLRTLAGPSLYIEREVPANGRFALPSRYGASVTDPSKALGHVRSGQEAIKELCARREDRTFFGVHHEPVAGGNVITARNDKDQLRFIVGDFGALSVFKEMDCENLAAAEDRIRTLLLGQQGESKDAAVIFVPQWAYHLDLQLFYLGRGKLAMHCFYKQQALVNEFFFQSRNAALRSGLQTRISSLINKYREIQTATKKILEAQGFSVVDVAGIFPTSVDNGHVRNANPDDSLFFCFLNGLALFPDKVLVPHDENTGTQFIELAYELFKDDLKEAGIETVAVGNHVKAQPQFSDVQAFMQKEEGGLRCKTTTLPSACIAAERLRHR